MRCVSGERAAALNVRAPKHHRRPSGSRWIASLARGGTALAIACAVAGTTIAAAGHVLALAIDAHSDARSLVGLSRSSGRMAWFAGPDTTMIPQQIAARPALQAGALPADGSRMVLAATSGSLAEDDDVVFTGSIGNGGGRFIVDRKVPDMHLDNLTRARAPLPRSRPQLAALTPPHLDLRFDEPAPNVKTAIYDIAARIVYMPNGERLEAHSGFGEHMDDPRYVRLRMRGVTPPNTYRLTMREALFHGTEAIRLTPENKDAMFGRNGILAHPYLLGPNGQSNGCVSIRDYDKFLAAFKRGEVERMVVVFRLDKPPSFMARGGVTRSAKLL